MVLNFRRIAGAELVPFTSVNWNLGTILRFLFPEEHKMKSTSELLNLPSQEKLNINQDSGHLVVVGEKEVDAGKPYVLFLHL